MVNVEISTEPIEPIWLMISYRKILLLRYNQVRSHNSWALSMFKFIVVKIKILNKCVKSM